MNGLSTSKLTLKLNSDTTAKTYSISYGDNGTVYTTKAIPVTDSLTYLTLLIVSLDEVTLNLFNGGGDLTATATFDSATQSIIKTPSAP